MRNIRLTIEYDGTSFCGWQLQKKDRTVQGVIEDALHEMTQEKIRICGAGRTDAGVHALGQVANFTTETSIPALGFQRGLTTALPADVAVIDAREVPKEFDARRSPHGKLYRYRIWNQEMRSPLERNRSWHIIRLLDVAAMNAAAERLIGEHDFAAFRTADDRHNTVRLVRRFEVFKRGPLVEIEVEATAFLKHMVRILSGTLVAAGRGEMSPEEVGLALESKDRTRAGITAPPQGLFLVEVYY